MYKIYGNFCLECCKHRIINRFVVKNYSYKVLNVTELDAAYVPHKVEQFPRKENTYFRPPVKDGRKYSMILPPPNVTGTLHLGHALTVTIQDILVRWKQMQGFETKWVPGIDHAGIATQVVVEKYLWNEKRQTRFDLGRERFLEEVWRWKEEKGNVIVKELRQLGVDLNWECETFTMNPTYTKAVEQAFIKLFDAGLIYRADYLVNWSCALRSAISDIEVEHIEVNAPTKVSVPGYEKPIEFGKLYKFAYKFEGQDKEEIVIATTRPETILGDVAVAVHKDDARYAKFIGRNLWHPFRQELIPVISDPFVDSGFGTVNIFLGYGGANENIDECLSPLYLSSHSKTMKTVTVPRHSLLLGAVKITPAHDQVDFEVGRRHSLKSLPTIDESGNITSICEEFQGIPRFKARDMVINRLQDMGLFRGTEDHKMLVPLCSRSKDVVELLVRPQWFVKCDEMASKALNAVKEGKLNIHPKVFEKQWDNWLNDIRDWCISRQLWWGHRIPAYHCSVDGELQKQVWVAAENESEACSKAARKLDVEEKSLKIVRDEDVLDTWFSASLQPFAAFGWPEQTEELSKYYPLSLMETGHDILFFWVARMIMVGTQLTGQLPFREVLLHGIICDAGGRKMSKSLGNVVAPEDIIKGISLESMEKRSKESYASGVLSNDELKRAIQGQRKMFPQGIPECGLDALRLTLVSHNIKNHYINFDVSECHANKLFCNKLWQATKFTKKWFQTVSETQHLPSIDVNEISIMDKWILSRLSKLVDTANSSLKSHDFHVTVTALKDFLHHNFCDVYVEVTKRGFQTPDSKEAGAHCWVLLTCLDIGFRCLAPFMPILSQHLHQSLPICKGEEKNLEYPKDLKWQNDELEKNVNEMMEIVVALRRLKKLFNLTAKHKPQAYIQSTWPFLQNQVNVVSDLANYHTIQISDEFDDNITKSCVKDSVLNTRIFLNVPGELLKNLELDIPNMLKRKEKLAKELEQMYKVVSGEKYKLRAPSEQQELHARKIISLKEKISRIDYINNIFLR